MLAADSASVSALYPSDTSPNCFSPLHWVLFHHRHPSTPPHPLHHQRVRNSALITCCRAITVGQSRAVSLTIHSNITLPWRRLPGAAAVYRTTFPLMFVVYAMALRKSCALNPLVGEKRSGGVMAQRKDSPLFPAPWLGERRARRLHVTWHFEQTCPRVMRVPRGSLCWSSWEPLRDRRITGMLQVFFFAKSI